MLCTLIETQYSLSFKHKIDRVTNNLFIALNYWKIWAITITNIVLAIASNAKNLLWTRNLGILDCLVLKIARSYSS